MGRRDDPTIEHVDRCRLDQRLGGHWRIRWDLNAGDRFFVADVDNDNADELVVVSPNGQWIGILEFQGDRFQATWIGNDWVNPPGVTGPNGWDLNAGDQFFVADVDGDGAAELVVVSPNGQWIGILEQQGGALVVTWIGNDSVDPPGFSGFNPGFLVNKKFRTAAAAPVPAHFARYNRLDYAADPNRDTLGYGGFRSYHPQLIDRTRPNIMDNNLLADITILCRFDHLTYEFLTDRLTAKAHR